MPSPQPDGAVSNTLIEAADTIHGMHAVEQLTEDPEPPTATSDIRTHAVAAVVRRTQTDFRPQQVPVIGFDDALIADLVGLTTIHQPLCEKGKTAATILLDLLDGRAPAPLGQTDRTRKAGATRPCRELIFAGLLGHPHSRR